MRPDFGISPDGGIHFTEMKTRTRKEGLKRRNKEEYEMDRLTRANASKNPRYEAVLLAFA
ncbi:hypothetical protein FA041_20235 [Escherichia coli]|nr:hypothetical protein [Escherichia coli]